MTQILKDEYEIVSVCPTDPPQDAEGTNWHCYVIGRGANTIRGYQRGSLQSVREEVEKIVARLNERRVGKRGRVHLTMSTGKKAAKTA